MKSGLSDALGNEQILDEFEARCQCRQDCENLDALAFLDSLAFHNTVTTFTPEQREVMLIELWRVQLSAASKFNAEFSEFTLRARFPDHLAIIDRIRNSRCDSETASGTSHIRRALATPFSSESEKPGNQFGPFELIQHLGTGGMGTVWKARQTEPVQRVVALKLIRAGLGDPLLLSRFQAERQALAVMSHPNIARMLEANQSESGQPYLVMELVSGPPITRFATIAELDIRQRVQLFLPVCHAIQHAHQKGIIHRDLKPSNILVATDVTTPTPVVIDFGLVKATEKSLHCDSLHTFSGQLVGTPDYMSPEQTRSGEIDVDTRTDIYSLGAVLYELLTGYRPLGDQQWSEQPIDALLAAIRDQDPVVPSQRVRSQASFSAKPPQEMFQQINPRDLQGDLDWIVMKALDKDRTRRYASASALAADLERYLDGESVDAAPPSRRYRLQKFMVRHRHLIATVTAVFAVMILGLIGTGSALNWALAERTKAQNARGEAAERAAELALALKQVQESEIKANQRADDLQRVADFQATQILQTDPSIIGSRIRDTLIDQRRELVNRKQQTAEAAAAELGAFEQALAGTNFVDVGLATLREDFFARLQREIMLQFESQPDVRLRLLEALATTAIDLGLSETACSLQSSVVALHQWLSGDKSSQTLAALSQQGALLHDLSRYNEADVLLSSALLACRENLDPGHEVTVAVALNYSKNLQRLGRMDDAESIAREANDWATKKHGPRSRLTLQACHLLAQILSERRKFSESEQILETSLPLARELCAPDDQLLINQIGEYGQLLERMRRFDDAIGPLREAFELCEKNRGRFHPATLKALNNLGSFLTMYRSQSEALPVLEDSLDRHRKVFGDFHQQTLIAEQSVAVPYFHMKKFDKAIEVFESVLPKLSAVYGESNEATVLVRANLAVNYRQVGRMDDALRLMEEAYSQRLASHDLAFIAKELFDTCLLGNRLDRAREIARQELAEVNQRSPQPNQERLLALWRVANWLRRSESWTEAEEYLRECLVMREKLEPGDWKLYDNQSVLGEVLFRQKKPDEAAQLLHSGYEGLVSVAEQIPRSWRREHIPNALKRLVELYQSRNDNAKAQEYLEKLELYETELKR